MPVPANASSLVAFGGGVRCFAGDDADAVDLSKPIDVEIALSGQYKTRNFELGAKQFDQMIANHQAASVDPAVDREHESWFSSTPGSPALGWVRGLKVAPAAGDARRKALVASVELNDLGQAAVKNGHFRYVSMGYDKAGKHPMTGEPIGARLDHLALVKNPFIQGMRPLSLALSSQLGRLAEEEPMEQLAQKLREVLGLSADAPEEQIITALAADAGKRAAALTDREALSKALEEQKKATAAATGAAAEQLRLNTQLEAGLKALTDESEARKAGEWKSAVALAVKEFRITPAEATEHEKLTGAERALAGRLLALRSPNKPAGTVVGSGAGGAPLKGTDTEGLSAPQLEAVAAFKKSNPATDDAGALLGAMAANPSLFSVEG